MNFANKVSPLVTSLTKTVNFIFAKRFAPRNFFNGFLGRSIRSIMRVERDGSTGTLTIHPADGTHSATVILMHGLGDSAEGLSDLAENWMLALPHVKFILPTASIMPVTLNGGMPMTAWYDIVGLDDRASESCNGIEASVQRVRDILSFEHSSVGMPYSRMMLAGFSQGGAMSLFTGLQLPDAEQKLAGLMVMSGYLPAASQFKLTAGFESVPVRHVHGSADPVVRPDWAKMTEAAIKAKGLEKYHLSMHAGVGHSISGDMLREAQEFIGRCLPHSEEFVIKPKPPREMSVKELKVAIRHHGLGQQAVGFTEKDEFIRLLEEHYASKGLM